MRKPAAVTLLVFIAQLFLFQPVQAGSYYADSLKNVKAQHLELAAWNIYNKYIADLDSADAFAELERMESISRERNSPALKALPLFLKGKYCFNKYLWRNSAPLHYFEQALKKEKLPDHLEAQILFFKGFWYYFGAKNYPLAFEYMLEANAILEESGYKDVPVADELLLKLSVAYYQFGEIPKAIKYLSIAKTLPGSSTTITIEINNTLGIAYRDSEKIDSALYYFHKALTLAKVNNNKAWIGIISGNLGSVYNTLNRPDEALPYYLKDYYMGIENRQDLSAANSAISIAQLYFNKNNIDSAFFMLQKAKALAYKCNDLHNYISLYRLMSGFYKFKGDKTNALLYTDSLLALKDSLWKINKQHILGNANEKIKTEIYLKNIDLLSAKKDKELLIRNGFILFALLLCVIIFQLFTRSQSKRKQEKKFFEIENNRAQEEIKRAKVLLDNYIDNLKQKNKLIEQFSTEIEELHNNNNTGKVEFEKEETLKRLQQSTILTEEDWIAFKQMFTNVYPSFFIDIYNKYPNLTQAEIRLLALSELHLSVKEKAIILGISPDSVRKTQQRLNKKINIPEQEVIESA